MRLPSPSEIETIKTFLTEVSGLFVEGVEFGKPASGLSLRVWYRDMRGNSQRRTMLGPDTKNFQDLVILMSDWLEVERSKEISHLSPILASETMGSV